MRKFNHKFNTRITTLLCLVIGVLGVFAVGTLMDQGSSLIEALGLAGSGMSYAVMAAIGNIDQVSDKNSCGNNIAYKIWLIHKDQVNQSVAFPTFDANGDIGTIPLKAGEYMHYFEAVDDTPDDSSAGSKGDVSSTVTNTFKFTIGGNFKKLRDFCENHMGDKFLIIYQEIDSKDYFLVGTWDKMMKLKEFARSTKDNRSLALTFENTSFIQPHKYTGAITSSPATVLAADAIEIAFTAVEQYTTNSANTAATAIATIRGLQASDAGRVVVINGGGGTNASTIASSSTFVLKNAAGWTGRTGSKLTLKVLDVNTLVEISRIQTT